MEKKKLAQPTDILSLFVLMAECKNKAITGAFDSFKKVLLEADKNAALKAYRELLKISHLETKDLDKKSSIDATYAEIISVSSLILDFCLGENRRVMKTEGKTG
jgi:hypothetical protein